MAASAVAVINDTRGHMFADRELSFLSWPACRPGPVIDNCFIVNLAAAAGML